MKHLLTVFLVLTGLIFPQTYHTISIDGTNDFSQTNEGFETTSANYPNYSAYVTWDATKLYIGFKGNTPAGTLTDNARVIHIYLDTDPQLVPTNGTGTTDGVAWRWHPTLPFSANYHYAFKTIDNSEYKNVFSSGSWQNATFTTSNFKSSGFWEVSMLLSDLDSPSQVYVCAYVEEDWDGGYISLGLPKDLFTNTNTQGLITFNSHWLGFTLTSGVNPNSGSYDNALPVELTSFSAATIGSKVKLSWNTATEINNYGFAIERKVGSPQSSVGNYEKIGFVNGNGNSNSPKSYSFVDDKVSAGKYLYRLKQIDNDGQFEYSKTVEINFNAPKKFELSQNYPNPFNPSTTISYNILEASNVKLTIYNLLGQEIKTLVNEFKEAGVHTINFNASELNSGLYIYKLQAGAFSQTRKMTLIK